MTKASRKVFSHHGGRQPPPQSKRPRVSFRPRDETEAALKRVLSEVSVGAGYGLELVGVDGDHVHLFLTAPPDTPPSEVARRLKGASARRMRAIFPWLERRVPGGALWSPSFFVASVGAISEGAVRRYVAAQGAPG